MKKAIIGIVAVVVIIGILLFAYTVPYGVDDKKPSANVKVLVKDMGTGQTFTAQIFVGHPLNTLAVNKPSVKFQPLETYEQTVSVFSDHKYQIWIMADFEFQGTNIQTWTGATASFLGKTNSSNTYLCGAEVEGIFNGNPLHVFSTDDLSAHASQGQPITSPWQLGMSKPWDTYASLSSDGTIKSGFTSIMGTDIDGINVHANFAVTGIDQTGNTVTGTVTADLLIHASVTSPAGSGSITLTVTGMSAGGLNT